MGGTVSDTARTHTKTVRWAGVSWATIAADRIRVLTRQAAYATLAVGFDREILTWRRHRNITAEVRLP
jgi:hypothetical protein